MKSIFISKVFWVNIASLISLFTIPKFGIDINPDTQFGVAFFNLVNIVLRLITKEPVKII